MSMGTRAAPWLLVDMAFFLFLLPVAEPGMYAHPCWLRVEVKHFHAVVACHRRRIAVLVTVRSHVPRGGHNWMPADWMWPPYRLTSSEAAQRALL